MTLYPPSLLQENNKVEAIKYEYYVDPYYRSVPYNVLDSSHLRTIVSNMNKLRWLKISTNVVKNEDEDCYDGPIFHSNELRYIAWDRAPRSSLFLDTFTPVNLVVLKLSNNTQEELWKGCKHLPHLKEFNLGSMRKLVKIPEFDGVVLQKLKLYNCCKLKEIPPSLGNCTDLEHVRILKCPSLRMFPTFVHMKNLKILQIESCDLSDGEIPDGIGELFNLQELILGRNNFSRLDFSLTQLTQLKHLDLSYCRNLIEIPKLPLGIAIFNVDNCPSLTLTKDWYKGCEWLCEVSFVEGQIINDGGGLLHSMLKGRANENGSMLLVLRGAEIPKAFTPHLVKGRDYRLELPDNWCNDFSGFLICLVLTKNNQLVVELKINSSVKDQGMDDEDEVVREVSYGDPNEHTMVWYVSFTSLRDTSWWKNQTYKVLRFEFNPIKYVSLNGCGVRLLDKKSSTGLTESLTTITDSSGSPYTPKLKIDYDSASALRMSVHSYAPPSWP